MRRLGILVVTWLVACGGSPTGPAWPERQDPEEDGGQSLEPEAGAVAVEASSGKDEAPVEIAEILEETFLLTPAATSPEATPAAPTNPEEVIYTEEITIEIEE
jgi:hypothetical protein